MSILSHNLFSLRHLSFNFSNCKPENIVHLFHFIRFVFLHFCWIDHSRSRTKKLWVLLVLLALQWQTIVNRNFDISMKASRIYDAYFLPQLGAIYIKELMINIYLWMLMVILSPTWTNANINTNTNVLQIQLKYNNMVCVTWNQNNLSM